MTQVLARTIGARLASSKKSVLLLGARQVGKSTLTRSLSPDLTINLADEGTYLRFAKDPDRFAREIRALRHRSLVVVDEIQRVPSLLNSVQALLDEDRPHRYLLTGSSARKLKRGGANLLPGRILLEQLDPLSYWELGDDFDLDRALQVGTLPGIYLDRDEGMDVLDTYATVYLREEIQAEALTRDIGNYARFLDLAAASSGQWINYSKLASDSEIPKETIRRFFQILEDTLLAFRIPAYELRNSSRRVSQRDRFVIFDLGVRNALLGQHRAPVTLTEKGMLFEQFVIQQCLTFIRAHRLPWRLFAYRTDGGAEVDLIIDRGRDVVAIETKLGRNVAKSATRGLQSFREVADKPVQSFVVFQGPRAQRLDLQTEAVPYEVFFSDTLPSLA